MRLGFEYRKLDSLDQDEDPMETVAGWVPREVRVFGASE